MKFVRSFGVSCLSLLMVAVPAMPQSQTHVRKLEEFGIPLRQRPEQPLPKPHGFEDHVVAGNLVLTLEDSIRLALMNNTQIRLDFTPVENAENNWHATFAPFDPALLSSFNDTRFTQPASTELQGASVLKYLQQNVSSTYNETFQTGTQVQAQFLYDKLSTNSSFSFYNPSLTGGLQFTVTQPLLKNFGLFPNQAPIVIAKRNIRIAQATFEAAVNDLILNVVYDYWFVVSARENVRVARLSMDMAQKSYERDKKSLELGALPPLNIYRSESEVAQRKFLLVQAEYSLTQAQDQFRYDIGADIDPATQVLDLNLTDNPDPGSELLTADIPTVLDRAIANRPELDVVHQQLANDETTIKYAHNQLRPDLELSGLYASNSIAGVLYNDTVTPAAILGTTGLGNSLSQLFHFNNPTYGATLSLNLPIRNHAAEANLGNALVSRMNDRFSERQNKQNVGLQVTTAVHNLESAKVTLAAARVATDLARKTVDAEQRKYEIQGGDVFYVLQAQQELGYAGQYLVSAQIQYQQAIAALDHSTNELLKNHHVQISDPRR